MVGELVGFVYWRDCLGLKYYGTCIKRSHMGNGGVTG